MIIQSMGKLALFIVIVVFLILSLPNIYNPGINIDGADEAIACDFIFKYNSEVAQKGKWICSFWKIL